MSAAQLPYQPRIQTNTDWREEPWVFWIPPYDPASPQTNTPEDFTDCDLLLGLYDRASGQAILQARVSTGGLTLFGTNEVNVDVARAVTGTLAPYAGPPEAPALCDFDLIVIHPDQSSEPLLYGVVELVLGIAHP